MRNDMAKVVTEKPRRGSFARSKKYGRRLTRDEVITEHDAIVVGSADDDTAWGPPTQVAAHRAKMSRHGQYGWDAKEFTDVLNPLRRYLRKQVGRPWNKVYSELTAHLDRRSMTGRHIWTHVMQEVEVHTHLGADGKTVYPCPKFQWIDELDRRPVAGLYVHPRTGLLCYKPGYYEQVRKRYRERKAAQPIEKITIDDLHTLEIVNGIWYAVTYVRRRRFIEAVWLFRGTQHERVLTPAHWEEYNDFAAKRQLSRTELRENDLRNEARA